MDAVCTVVQRRRWLHMCLLQATRICWALSDQQNSFSIQIQYRSASWWWQDGISRRNAGNYGGVSSLRLTLPFFLEQSLKCNPISDRWCWLSSGQWASFAEYLPFWKRQKQMEHYLFSIFPLKKTWGCRLISFLRCKHVKGENSNVKLRDLPSGDDIEFKRGSKLIEFIFLVEALTEEYEIQLITDQVRFKNLR